ncbi:hypothetical protein [Halorussus ruber]|nr:hypothetical protein [Halorussus ruber]
MSKAETPDVEEQIVDEKVQNADEVSGVESIEIKEMKSMNAGESY